MHAQAIIVMLDSTEQAHSYHNSDPRYDVADCLKHPAGSMIIDTGKHSDQKRVGKHTEVESAAEQVPPSDEGGTPQSSSKNLPASPVSLSKNKVAAMKNVGSMIFRSFLQRTESDPLSKQVSAFILDKAKAAATNPVPTASKKAHQASSKSRFLSSYAEKAKMQTPHTPHKLTSPIGAKQKAKKRLSYHSIMNVVPNTPRMRSNEQKTVKEILWASTGSPRGQAAAKRKDLGADSRKR